MTSAYLRYPHLHGDLITFTADDDVWLAPLAGGRAWRLTTDGSPVRNPRFSPDGAHIAFTSFRDGHPEVMVADVESGRTRRLTWWGGISTTVIGWTSQGQVLVSSNAGQASIRHLVVSAVGLDGSVESLPYGPASGVAIGPDAAVALATPWSRPPAHWKRYRGGTAPRLWLDREGNQQWERLLPKEQAGLHDPMWVQRALVFASDRAARFPDHANEQANLWLWRTPGEGEPVQLTFQTPDEGYVRDATTDGERIVWHSRGRLYVLDGLDAQPREVELTVPGVAPQRFSADPTDRLEALVPDHAGTGSLVQWRGNAFWLTHREGPARALIADSGVRAREVTHLGRSGLAALVSDAEGEDRIEIHHLRGAQEPRALLAGEIGRVLHLASDPAGERLLAISHDGTIRMVDVAGGQAEVVARCPRGEALSPTFSPDGRYAAWTQPTAPESEFHQVIVLDTSGDEPPIAVTAGRFHDHSPAFTADGKHLVLLSDRTFDPHYDSHEFALSFAGATRPWLIPLSATEPAPFGPSADGWPLTDPDKESSAPESAAKEGHDAAPASPDLDADGAEERIVPFPVPSSNYRDLCVVEGGVTWVRETDEVGELGARRAAVSGEAAADSVEYWAFGKRKVTTVVDKVETYAVSGDGKHLVVRHGDDVTVTPATHKPEDADAEVVSVDLKRLRFEVDPAAQWLQMYDENARLMRDHYWRADMNGIDWQAVTQRWRPVVDQVATHDDLVDLLWEVGGELNTSHAYVLPASPLGDPQRRLGLLGIDGSPAEGGWRIDRILPSESSEPDARSPLRAAGVNAKAGDVITAIDGSPVDAAYGPGPLLVGAAERPVELTLQQGDQSRRVVVVPLADEEVLRYQDWVRSRRDYVHQRSGGRLGYLHVPDMTSYGWAQLHRDLRLAAEAEGVVADVRYNRGGHTSQLVIARLATRVVGRGMGRHNDVTGTYPSNAVRGPVVLVANEFSGSDGDIVNAAAQAMQVGPVVGVRTWGGVVGIDGRFDLVDGTTVTQPRYAIWLEGKGWSVENYGVDPDIEVPHSPADFFSDDDPQLDRAIAEALRTLEKTPASNEPPMPEPRVRNAR